ncbi:MAG: GMC family oxidoreductase [Myxococcales bacterium]|nr:GMC family oxidoreductase [Myxococcales bacterium]
MSDNTFEYVVVGGGSAGCVVAGSLARAGRRVLLLEAGDSAEKNPETLRAGGYRDAFVNPRLLWERFSTAQAGCSGKRIFVGTGRGVGGSGAVNAMVYLHGSAADFEAWPRGWRWSDVAPAYAKLDEAIGPGRRPATEFSSACIAAAEACGLRESDDLNDGTLLARIGRERMNFAGEARRSSYAAFVAPELSRAGSHLELWTHARARRLNLERADDGAIVACGVELERGDTASPARVTVRAEREVILCAGALETPKLLMLSGIGPDHELRSHGIDVAVARGGVGANLHDHPCVTLFYRSARPVDESYPQPYGFFRANPALPLAADVADTCYVFYPARSSLREAMMRLLPSMALPRVLYDNTPLPGLVRGGVDLAFRSAALRRFVERVYGIVVILGKPQSRGQLRLASANPRAFARVDPAYLTHPADMQTMLDGVALARRIAQSDALSRFGNRELMPGPRAASRAKLERFIRGNAMTTYHFAGTCRLGDEDDDERVVDGALRLRGVRGLRVADASVIPTLPVSAINAPSMMIGLRAAELAAAERR